MKTIHHKNVPVSAIVAINVNAYKWRDQNGNTYHSCYLSALVPFSLADELEANHAGITRGHVWLDLATESFTYGYGNGPEQTALELFKESVTGEHGNMEKELEILNGGRNVYIYSACKLLGIAYSETVQQVNRKKDL